MAKLLTIDGSVGGGQILRSALTLSMLIGQAFRLTQIRGARPKPGLQRQHLACVKAAAQIADAAVDGAELGSRELIFHPGKVQGGAYEFAIGTAGSTTLLLQTILLPLLLRGGQESRVRISGGTHNPLAPPFEFVERCFLPILRRMGAEIEFRLLRHGFVPAGGGEIECVIKPIDALKPIDLRERSDKPWIDAVALVSQVPAQIGQRGLAAMHAILTDAEVRVEPVAESACPGVVYYAMATCRDTGICEISTAFGQVGKTAEALASWAAKGLLRYLHSGAPIGVHLADQLLLPFALAGGGSFRTLPLDDHSETNTSVIRQFLGDVISATELGRGVTEVVFRG